MMADTINVPQIGPVKKNQVIAVGGVAAGILVYAWWRSRAAAEAEAEVAPEPEDPYEGSFGSGGIGGGPVSGYPTGPGSDTETSAPRTNAEWSQLAAEKLVASYDPKVIDGALGRYLSRRPLSKLDQEVVQAAIARAGYPPVGGPYTIVPGGDTKITTAPTGLRVTGTTTTTVTLAWNKLEGAGYYRLYRSGSSTNVGATDGGNTSITVGGLNPNTTYTFWIAADSLSDVPGPRSAPVKAKTKAVALGRPTGLRARSVGRTDVTVTCSPVKGAQYYRWYVNGSPRGASDQPGPYRIGSLRPNTTYKITCAADTGNQYPGPTSAPLTIRTKK